MSSVRGAGCCAEVPGGVPLGSDSEGTLGATVAGSGAVSTERSGAFRTSSSPGGDLLVALAERFSVARGVGRGARGFLHRLTIAQTFAHSVIFKSSSQFVDQKPFRRGFV